MDNVPSLNEDVVGSIADFLSFKEILHASHVCRSWFMMFGSKRVFRRIAPLRWPASPDDYGMGRSLEFLLFEGNYWKRRILTREKIQFEFSKVITDKDKLKVIGKIFAEEAGMYYNKRKDERARKTIYAYECSRWIVEVFDQAMRRDRSALFTTPEVPPVFIKEIIRLMSEETNVLWIQHLMSKTLGVLAIEEHNRMIIGPEGGIHAFNSSLRACLGRQPDVVANSLWGLVICSRPLGGIEGEAYRHSAGDDGFNNINIMGELGTVEIVLETIKTYREHPQVLSKAFWLLVNLALVDRMKADIINSRGVELILEAMKRYPTHEELQYRSNFALINVSIKSHAKEVLLNNGGIDLILQAMRTFSGKKLIQKCCTNVIRSLLSSDTVGIKDAFQNTDAILLLSKIRDKFDDAKLLRCAQLTINMLS